MRKFYWVGILVVAVSVLTSQRDGVRAFGVAPDLAATSAGFQRFVDELPIPPRLIVGDQTDVTVTLSQFQYQVHQDLPITTEWGYNGTSPGPVIEVETGHKVRVHWKNQLPTTHILAAPAGVEMGVTTPGGLVCNEPPFPDVRNVTHLHGAVVSETEPMNRQYNNDGWPDAWNVPGDEQIAEYPNVQSARILWYHDHAVGETGRNVAAGLIGMYLIHDDFERSLNLPTGNYDVPLIIQARGLNGDGSLYYSKTISTEYYGNSVSVNGKLWPYMNVEPRKYRFRFLNASNARAYAMQLVDFNNLKLPGPPFYQIGSDAGFLAATVKLNDPTATTPLELILASAERADVIIDFSEFAGRTLLLTNNMRSDDPDSEIPIAQIMQFKVGTTVTEKDTSQIPDSIRPIQRMDPASAVNTRQITFTQSNTPDGSPMLQLNGKTWEDPITEKPVAGSTEVWELINTVPGTHPFHIHLVQFQVIDRHPFDVTAYTQTGKINYTAAAVLPDANEMGWKDVVRVTAGNVTRIIMKFNPDPGYYVYHCHILEHEDMDMMRPFQIVAP